MSSNVAESDRKVQQPTYRPVTPDLAACRVAEPDSAPNRLENLLRLTRTEI